MFNWKDYHQLALRLELPAEFPGLREASLRTCISRFYYGGFRTAVRIAKLKGFVESGSGNDHSSVRRHFQRRGKHEIAHLLKNLQLCREQGDYQDLVDDLPATVQMAKSMAEQLYRLLGVQ